MASDINIMSIAPQSQGSPCNCDLLLELFLRNSKTVILASLDRETTFSAVRQFTGNGQLEKAMFQALPYFPGNCFIAFSSAVASTFFDSIC